jgi:hypothetical protein
MMGLLLKLTSTITTLVRPQKGKRKIFFSRRERGKTRNRGPHESQSRFLSRRTNKKVKGEFETIDPIYAQMEATVQ